MAFCRAVRTRSPNRRTFLLGAFGALAATGGCAISEGSTDQVEQRDLLIGALPIVGAAPLYLAAREGLFEQVGLHVRLQKVTSGAFAVPELLAGRLDITFSNHPSLIQNFAARGPARILAEGSRAAPDNFAVVAPHNSPLREVRDLRGRRVAVNAFHNIATLTINVQLQSSGIRADEVQYVQMDFAEMTGALLAGAIDAAFLPEPFLSAAEIHHGVKRLLDPTSGAAAEIPIDGYGALASLVEQKPNTVRAFRTALAEAQQRCRNPVTLTSVLERDLKIDRQIADVLSPSDYPISTDTTSLQRVATLMRMFGSLDREIDIGPMVVST